MTLTKNKNALASLQHQYELLRMEYEFEKDAFETQSRQQGIDRQVKNGKCWYPLSVNRSFYNSVNQLIVEIECTAAIGDEHDFEPGRPVSFFNGDMGGQPRYLNVTGTVSFVDGIRMSVILPNQASVQKLQAATSPGVQLYFDETSYNVMFTALMGVINTKEGRLAELRDVIVGNRPPEFRSIFPVRFPWLNRSQEEAVNKVICAKDVAVVHGPPGTGKTTTLVEAIYETLQREPQVLVCAQSNTAVDWIAEKMQERGISVLRVGNPLRVSDTMLACTYEHRFESHPDYTELWSIRKGIRDVQSQMRKGGANRDSLHNRLHKLKSRATELEIRIDSDIFSEVRVVASTLIGVSNKVLSRKHFSTLFIDEAAQALEAACWNGIRKAERVVFAGDHCQLPPTVKCIDAARGGLDETLMEKIVLNKKNVVSLLTTQYRMHESIMAFPSEWFYNGALKAAKEIVMRSELSMEHPVVWYNTSECGFREESSNQTLSRLNKAEARQLITILEEYMTKIGVERIIEDNMDFGIISPYKSQVYYLRGVIKKNSFLRRFRKQISVNTVDGFQGQERDVIFLSMVRGNDEGRIGFLADLRRMNVAITRARHKLVILGDASTLTSHKFYHKLYEHIERFGSIENLKPENSQIEE